MPIGLHAIAAIAGTSLARGLWRPCASRRTPSIWAGAGTAAIALIGMIALGEPATALRLGSIALIVIGVVGLNASGAH